MYLKILASNNFNSHLSLFSLCIVVVTPVFYWSMETSQFRLMDVNKLVAMTHQASGPNLLLVAYRYLEIQVTCLCAITLYKLDEEAAAISQILVTKW